MTETAISTPEIYRVIGQRVRAERHKRKLTQDELAERVQLTRTSITNIERGRQKLLLHTLFAFAAAFEIEAKELLADICVQYDHTIKKNLPRDLSPEIQRWIISGASSAHKRTLNR
jgi:transcriptional regulator with XRE-family HTH domain